MKPRPVNNNVLCLKRILRTAIARAASMDKVDEVVLICPITPTGCPKVEAMSTRSSPDAMFGGVAANLAKANAGRRNLPLVLSSDGDEISSTVSPFVSF